MKLEHKVKERINTLKADMQKLATDYQTKILMYQVAIGELENLIREEKPVEKIPDLPIDIGQPIT